MTLPTRARSVALALLVSLAARAEPAPAAATEPIPPLLRIGAETGGGIVGGLIGVFVMQRDMAFAVHGISELSFAGAAGALLFGANVVVGSLAGSLVAAILIVLLAAGVDFHMRPFG